MGKLRNTLVHGFTGKLAVAKLIKISSFEVL